VTVEFFNTNTFVRSGASTLTRRMAMSQSEMYALYRAHFPMLVRKAEVMADSGLYGPLTSFLAKQLARANEMSAAEGWDQSDEMQRRAEWFKDQRSDHREERAKYVKAPLNHVRTTDDPDQNRSAFVQYFLGHLEASQRSAPEIGANIQLPNPPRSTREST
jgi:hypothetical protein